MLACLLSTCLALQPWQTVPWQTLPLLSARFSWQWTAADQHGALLTLAFNLPPCCEPLLLLLLLLTYVIAAAAAVAVLCC
jgi:hypothetical protein